MGGDGAAEAREGKDYCLTLCEPSWMPFKMAEYDVKSYRTHCLEFIGALRRDSRPVHELRCLLPDPS